MGISSQSTVYDIRSCVCEMEPGTLSVAGCTNISATSWIRVAAVYGINYWIFPLAFYIYFNLIFIVNSTYLAGDELRMRTFKFLGTKLKYACVIVLGVVSRIDYLIIFWKLMEIYYIVDPKSTSHSFGLTVV